MTVQAVATGLHVASGSADNIQVGFIPDVVKLYKVNGTVPAINVWLRLKVCAFTSGGTTEIKPGDVIQGATSKLVRAEVRRVAVTSGSWAGGDAAGFFFWQDWNQTGAFTSENVDLLASGSTVHGGGGISLANAATVTAQTEKGNYALAGAAIATESSVTFVTPANGIQPYSGSDGANSEGFTITDTLSTAGDIWYWEASRGTLVV
jgi:hypothetical protein